MGDWPDPQISASFVSAKEQLIQMLKEYPAIDESKVTWGKGPLDVGRTQIAVGDVANAFRRRHGPEYDRPITARYVGSILRNRLHLNPVKRHGAYVLDPGLRSRVVALGERYGSTMPSP